ncbi:MAG: 4-hydroxy-tetrahydrodipicolinate reductase [Deltaproteobacteria bacterium]|jgi:4-hydroxy-tetrahydrodipicolinate reductase|nr:4-hydroxy-tetrahydrodipicolinate reductase [Deltaproteobacteria bacterium]
MRLIVIAPRGKMGLLITRLAHADPRFELVAGIGPKGRAYIGRDLGVVAGLGEGIGVSISDDLASVIDGCDAIIDFSIRETSMQVLKLAVEHKKALVCGTTGFNAEERAAFAKAAEVIPVMLAANTSKLVNCMNKLLEICAKTLADEADIEIIEMHDRDKLDAPSGTSKEMGHLLAEAMGKEIGDLAVYGREGSGVRKPGSIGYHSVRAGSTPSSHIVIFGCAGERLEIAHHSYNWECFARGALSCALFLEGKKPGSYSVKDVLGM